MTNVAISRIALLDPPALVASPAREADRSALTALYAEHGASIFRFLRDLLGCAALAADATQETFVRAFRQLDVFADGRPVAPWLFGIARNVSLEARKARARSYRMLATRAAESDARAAPPESPESELLGREALDVVAAALDKLTEERRAMLLLRLDHGLSYDAIASLMGFTLAKTKVEIFRAREVLRATMAAYESGDGGSR